jgi:hypothetical protein
MEEPTIKERERWWLLCYAATAMEKTITTCELIQDTCSGEDNPLFEALCLASHAHYARPFIKNFGVGRIEIDVVPNNQRGVHDWLMDFRNTTMVHTDSTRHASDGVPLSNVLYSFRTGQHLFTTTFPAATLGNYQDVIEHCVVMRDVFKRHLIRFHDSFGHLIPESKGDHLLSLEPSTPTFIEDYDMPTNSSLSYERRIRTRR